MPVCKKCEVTFPNRLRLKGKIRILKSRKFCPKCSPFGDNNRQDISQTLKTCTRCQKSKPFKEFYRRTDRRRGYYGMCRVCWAQYDRQRLQQLKKQCVEYKGGACAKCGYGRCLNALEFHHRDPEKKDFKIGGSRQSFELLKKELDKCDLLCANCHREEHNHALVA